MGTNRCKCILCTTYDNFRCATISECKCLCHSRDVVTGHDNLCCEFPNGLKKDNPDYEYFD